MIKKLFRKLFRCFGYEVRKSGFNEVICAGTNSYSQCGEDLIIDYVFKLRDISSPTYIDIGAHDPHYINNTAIFYQRGCRGINIEANPHLLKNLKNSRPEDININIGISDQEGELNFHIMQDSTLSTFSEIEYSSMIQNGKELSKIEKIKLSTIEFIIEKYCKGIFPDLLSLDAEGMDLHILKSINFEKSSPKVICVEAAEFSIVGAGARRDELIDFLVANGYYEYANTNLNAIMVRRDFWFV